MAADANPPFDFWSTLRCVDRFLTASGYAVHCRDGLFSDTGGTPDACSGQGGVWHILAEPVSSNPQVIPGVRLRRFHALVVRHLVDNRELAEGRGTTSAEAFGVTWFVWVPPSRRLGHRECRRGDGARGSCQGIGSRHLYPGGDRQLARGRLPRSEERR